MVRTRISSISVPSTFLRESQQLGDNQVSGHKQVQSTLYLKSIVISALWLKTESKHRIHGPKLEDVGKGTGFMVKR